jgi:lipoprotein NlpI
VSDPSQTMAGEPVQQPGPPIGTIVVLAVAAVFYLGMMVCLVNIQSHGDDAVGRTMAEGFGIMFAMMLWVVLGILLLLGGTQGAMPAWSAGTATILLPISAFTVVIVVGLLDRGASANYMLVPAAIPPLFAGYAMWARLPSWRRALPALPTSIAVWAAVALLTAVPMPHYIADQRAKLSVINQERAEAEAAAAKAAAQRRATAERFHSLTMDSPLWDWAAFFGKDSAFDAEAIAGANKLPHLQADAEEALRRGMGFPLIEYQRLNVAATPAYCAAASDFLIKDAAAHKAPDGEAEYTEAAQPYIEPDDVAVIEWLTEHCDIDEAVAQIRASVGSYKQTRSRDAYLGVLAWRRGNGFFRRGDRDRALDEYSEAIRLSPDNAQFYNDRAQRYSDRNDYPHAIADYDVAIRLNSGYSRAFNGRGLAYYFSGDNAHALEDFNEAIRQDPNYGQAINNRGNAEVRDGSLDRAIDDYTEAGRLLPKSHIPLANRGEARLYQAAYKQAADDLAAALAMKPADPYLALSLYLARARDGQDARAALTGDAAQFDRGGWPWPLVAVYLGQGDTKTVLADLRQDTNPNRKSQECEADFYLGAKAALDGDTAAARDLLQTASAACGYDYAEKDGARYELARLP